MRVLVLDAASRVALATVRALGERGAWVEAGEQRRFLRPRPPAFASRWTRRTHELPDLGEAFLPAVERAAREVDVVLPVATNTVLRLAEGGLTKAPLAPLEVLKRANGKASLLALAAEQGIPTPRTERPSTLEEAVALGRRWRWPAVVKLVDDEGLFLAPGQRYRIVRSREEFFGAFGALHALKPWPLVQEFIRGEGYGYAALFERGVERARFCHRRLREFPPTGGPSTACESVVEPELAALGRRLLEALGWHGVAMVEFRREFGSGRWVLMEVNPRLWGSLPLPTACGVNFPWLWCSMAMGNPLGEPPRYPAGRRLRFLAHDLAGLWRAPRTLPGVVRDLFTRDGALAWSDPHGSLQYIRGLLGNHG